MRSTTLAGSSAAAGHDLPALGFCSMRASTRVPVLVADISRARSRSSATRSAGGPSQLPAPRPRCRARAAVERLGRDDLVGEQEVSRHSSRPWADGGQVCLVAAPAGAMATLFDSFNGLEEQGVGLRRPLLRHEVSGPLVVDGVDLVEIDEVLDVDGPRVRWGQPLQFLRGD